MKSEKPTSGKEVIRMDLDKLKQELTEEQYNTFVEMSKELGIEEALAQLPSLGNSPVFCLVNERIKQLRVENGFSQNDLATVLGISQREYWRCEQPGYNPNLMRLAFIAMFYNVTLDWISGFSNEKKPFGNGNYGEVNGYVMQEMKEAKAKGISYQPHID